MRIEEFLKQAEVLGEAMADEVIAAEQQYEYHNKAALPIHTFPNTDYWDKMGPVIDSYRRQQRQDILGKELDQAVDNITLKYDKLINDLEVSLS